MKIMEILNEMVNESSYSRILQHIQNNDTFAVVSAFRGSNSDDENMKLHKQLKGDVRAKGYGFIEQKSGYSYSEPGTGEEGTVDEMSLFIPKISEKEALTLGRKYDQETIIFKDNKKFVLINCSTGGVDMTFKKSSDGRDITFDPSVLKYAFSQLVKANKSQRGKYAFKTDEVTLHEMQIPSRHESYLAMKTGKLAEARWIKIF